MRKDRKRTEEREVELSRKLDEKVAKKMEKENRKAEKRKNSKFRNSKFGKKWFALKKWQRIVVYVVIALLLLALIGFATIYGIYNSFRTDINEENLGISSEIEDKYGDTDIFNIALFGVDTRDEDSFSGRSDTIIIASVDRANNTVKLTSILRDSYVAIEGHSNQKITHAYAFGGAELAIKTINQNFGMNITDYATVNFAKMAEAIDILGGIDIEVSEEERQHLNQIGDDDDPTFNYLEESGYVHLTGEQAVVYARLRKIDSDVERSNRQRKVLEALLVQAKKVSPAKYGEMVRTMMTLCETSLSFSEIMSFAPMIKEDISIQTLTIPGDEENAIGGIYEGYWVWRYDLSAATQHIHEFIYGEPLDVVPDSVITSGDTNNKNTADKGSGSNKGNESSSTEPDTTKPQETTTAPITTTTAPATTVTEPTTNGQNNTPAGSDPNKQPGDSADGEEPEGTTGGAAA